MWSRSDSPGTNAGLYAQWQEGFSLQLSLVCEADGHGVLLLEECSS